MNTYVGIDLGTSGMKLLLVAEDGRILSEASESYPVCYPQDGYSEQNPEDWVTAAKKGLDALFSGGKFSRADVRGVSFGGQMHGMVLLDEKDCVIRPAILWNDGRTGKEAAYLNTVIGEDALIGMTGNIAFPSFTATRMMWMRENEPEAYAKVKKLCLPKDYLAYRMTGVFSSEYSDASGLLLLDVENKCYSKEMCRLCGVDEAWLPPLYESYEVTGRVLPEFDLPNAIATAGAGDNAAASVGMGAVCDGDCNLSVGTSGTLVVPSDRFKADPSHALHSFAHATGKWHYMGVVMSAASTNKWWVENVLNTGYGEAVSGMEEKLGDNSVYFLPYLMGERCPYNDVSARGAFIGMRLDTTREDMSLAVLEGVAFAFRDCLELVRACGVSVSRATICGGGAKSALWCKIIANVLNIEVCSCETEQGPAYGAAMLAMVGAGAYGSVEEVSRRFVRVKRSVKPDVTLTEKYAAKYAVYKTLYPALASAFGKM